MKLHDVLLHTSAGGWGEEIESDDCTKVRIIRGADFPDAALRSVKNCPVRFETTKRLLDRVCRKNDIILETSGGTSKRPTGRSILISDDLLQQSDEPIIPASFCRLIRVDQSKASPRFIYWALQYFYLTGLPWEYQNRSTGISNFQFPRFANNWNLPDKPYPDQVAIANVLGALDDKIAANRKLVTTINELASVEYKKSAVTERTLTDLASFVNGRNFTKNATGDGRVVVRIAELNSGIGGSTVRNQVEDAADDNLVRPGDILFAWSGSLTVHRWTQPEALINQHIFKVIPNDDVPYWLAYQAVKEKLPEFKSIAADKATTMGHIQRRHLDTAVMVPSPDKISEIDPLMSSLWKRAITADEESRTLASLRDTLLPALMDGTIRVKDAEKQAEEVL